MAKVEIGPVSSGTLRTKDLLKNFADTLEAHLDQVHSEVRAETRQSIDTARAVVVTDRADTERASEVLEELVDRLCDIAPPYCWFGAHEGDGACFGFWVDIDAAVGARDHGELADEGLELEVNDHGNATLYQLPAAGSDRTEIWAVV